MNNDKRTHPNTKTHRSGAVFGVSRKSANFGIRRIVAVALAAVVIALAVIPAVAVQANQSPIKIKYGSYGTWNSYNMTQNQLTARATDGAVNTLNSIADYMRQYCGLIPLGIVEMVAGTKYGYAIVAVQDITTMIDVIATDSTLEGSVVWYTKYKAEAPTLGQVNASTAVNNIVWRKTYPTYTQNGVTISTPTHGITPVTGVGTATSLQADMVADAQACLAMPTKTQADVDEAFNRGEWYGWTNGYEAGYETGAAEGYNIGYSYGSALGYTNGYTDGVADGYETGFADGVASVPPAPPTEGDTVVLDIPAIVTSVPQAVRNMFDSAFDLTLFGGTQYQVNVGQILAVFLGVAATVGVLVIILKKVF